MNYFINSFILAISIAPLQVLYCSEGFPTTARINASEFQAEALRQQQVKDLLKVPPYVAAIAGAEPTTLRLKVIVSRRHHARFHQLSFHLSNVIFISIFKFHILIKQHFYKL